MKQYLGYIIKKAMGKGKVSPTIKSVKPNLKKTVKQTKGERFTKNIKALDRAEGKLKTGREMMREGQKERKKLVDTGRAFQFKGVKSFHAIGPGDKEKYGKSEAFLRIFSVTSILVYEPMDTCSCVNFWYKGYTNI